ncbi:MAG: DUF4336 domain-containing protein [Pseudomonadota bacterium]
MTQLRALADNIWTVSSNHTMLGIHLGSRMTVVRLSGGRLWLHSPIALSPQLRAELDALGQVAHIVCPNMFHHVYAGEAGAAYPQAKLHGPQGLRRKRKDLTFTGELTDLPDPGWASDLAQVSVRGCLLAETVFFHGASGTLISADLVENFKTSAHWPTRLYLTLTGLHGKTTWSPLLRLLYRDRLRARACVERILAWPIERVVLAHGDLLLSDARARLAKGLAWL